MPGEINNNAPKPTTGRLPATPAPRPTPAPSGQPARATTSTRVAGDQNAARTPAAKPPDERVNLEGVTLPGSEAISAAKGLKGTIEDGLAIGERAASRSMQAARGVQTAGKALGALGVVAALTELGKMMARSPVDMAGVLSCLGELGQNLASAAGELAKYPGLTKALQVFGGIGGVISGVMQLKETITDMMQNGANTSNVVGALAGGCSLIGGVCMAMTPFFPPLGAVGAGITLAGAALNVGKLAIDNWDAMKEFGGKAAGAVADGARAVGGAASRAWDWMVGNDQPRPALAR